MTVINVVIDGFSGEDLKWFAHVTVWLQVSNYNKLSDYAVRFNFADQLEQNTPAYALITFEEIVIGMIN